MVNIFLTFSLTENIFHNYFEKQVKDQVSSTLSGLDFGISILLDKGDLNSIQRMVEKIGAYSFIKIIRVYDLHNKIISSNDKGEINKKIKIEIVDKVIRENRLQNINSNLKEKKLEVAVPIKGTAYSKANKNDIMGVVFVQANTSSFEGILLKYQDLFIKKYIVSGTLLLLGILLLLVYKIFLPITKLSNAVNEVSDGDYKHEIIHNSHEEFSYLIQNFNSMIKRINARDMELKQVKSKLEEQNGVLEQKVDERTKELVQTQEVTIKSLAVLAETRDNETGMHVYRTKNYVRILAEHLKDHPRFSSYLNETNIELIVNSAQLHDIGKVGIPDRILRKKGKLTKDEFEEMKKHVIYGRDSILKAEKTMGTNSFLRFAKEIAYSHHEKWDGSGYPEGLAGEKIPICARLMAMADVYDALMSKRHYKEAFTHEEAVKIITAGDGRTMPEHFDPCVLESFKELNHKFKEIFLRFPERNS
ncbi:HD domain-containing protein [Psychrilyobacter piezotolerans]|uniref:HD domain-containing protein n=2 Tax=Fusobacteriaceae TaxID=203492 RepID=A0ABX9KJF5_9FUSO|nr:HD domain-containing protein [Psychrilyobacter piezotolerans]RDE64203.1 HD domain-containing protein [Psychrilyobacter sp. S5]REI42295.1 HD domain-containing protein [Psychrilyobacter piezotolerans]